MAKPPAKPGKPTPGESEATSKKLLFAAIGVLILAIAGGAVWYFTKGSSHTKESKAPAPMAPPKFIKLDTFTVNLHHEANEEERVLQTVINLEIQNEELEQKIKLFMPKIYNNLLILLSKKRASEISTGEGKRQLAKEIKIETEAVLGLRTAPIPRPTMHESNELNAASGVTASSSETVSIPVVTAPAATHGNEDSAGGIVSVLFTSFIIQ